MAVRQVLFKCLHCGHEYSGSYDPKNVTERSCPQCRSNSVWRRPKPKSAQKK